MKEPNLKETNIIKNNTVNPIAGLSILTIVKLASMSSIIKEIIILKILPFLGALTLIPFLVLSFCVYSLLSAATSTEELL
ncbi:hypothetical protein NE686_19580 [Tissierella carlieri]|uniref:Uncharacterized protein n=1 Tax=Tissierella carlieri TaxID=689904 RepID=A0ABT1SFR4_9FIRM|nr:hypothetical protein [Tissierella carlieri]MCQ4925315.1 hypothetical protein [Tissierella carlieri]